jgi:hypothetical protein
MATEPGLWEKEIESPGVIRLQVGAAWCTLPNTMYPQDIKKIGHCITFPGEHED